MSTDPTGTLRPQRINLWWRFIRRVAEFIVRVVFSWRVDVRHLDRVPADGAAILAWNHHGYFDFVMVAWDIVRRMRRPVRVLAKRELWESRATRWIVDGALAIPVDRGHGAVALRDAQQALAAGDLVMVAPEGTISPSFDLLPFKSGAVRLAQLSGAPIIPAIGWGTHRFYTKGNGPHLARRVPVVVEYGEHLHVAPDEDLSLANERLRTAMADLLDRVQRDYADGTPDGAWWVPARLGGGAPPHDDVLARAERRTRDDDAPPTAKAG